MSRRSGAGPKLDLKLNLSPPRAHNPRAAANPSPTQSGSPATNSPPSSCVSSEVDHHNSSSSPEATSMVLVGCPRCLMYVMLSEDDPKCPKCKSTVLLDFLQETNNNNSNSSRSRSSRKRS
ncbi:uncharacterized protein LOC116209420 isoform X2 [Punica granatum]|nr:uncharacterized protein LOC116209420 isoform X2 [Punica granatum]